MRFYNYQEYWSRCYFLDRETFNWGKSEEEKERIAQEWEELRNEFAQCHDIWLERWNEEHPNDQLTYLERF